MKGATIYDLVLGIDFLVEGILIFILAYLFHIARVQYRDIQGTSHALIEENSSYTLCCPGSETGLDASSVDAH
jgi:hypothetical protein